MNCAAWTAVDAAEEHEDEALAINGHGAANLAAACARRRRPARPPLHRLRLRRPRVRPVRRGRADRPRGRLRPHQAGRRAGGARRPPRRELHRPHRLAVRRPRQELRQDHAPARRGTAPPPAWSPTSTASPPGPPTSPPQIYALIDASAPAGIYHATSSGQTTWFGFAEEIFPLYKEDQTENQDEDPERVRLTPRPITTADYPTPAKRPAYSVLGHDSWHTAGIEPIGDWKDALHRAFPAILAPKPSAAPQAPATGSLGSQVRSPARGSASWRRPGRTLPA